MLGAGREGYAGRLHIKKEGTQQQSMPTSIVVTLHIFTVVTMRLNNILCSDTRVKCCAIFNKQANSSKTHDSDVVDGRLFFFAAVV